MMASVRAGDCKLADQVWSWLADVMDPEIPVVSVIDLGMIRAVDADADAVTVRVSPTYSGCPAVEVIEESIVSHLGARTSVPIHIERVLSPAWTTDWITAAGRRKLEDYGIAPPSEGSSRRELLGVAPPRCPRCRSVDTVVTSEFGSTACKAACRCNGCLEPFEYFKCL